MRTALSIDRRSWFYGLDYKRLILIAFLARFILACAYDIFVSVNGKDIIVPDSNFYSTRGRYVQLILNGYNRDSLTRDLLPRDDENFVTIFQTFEQYNGRLPNDRNESTLYVYLVGVTYFIFGCFPLLIRVLNILLSIGSAWFLFMIARRRFGELTANIFLTIALFLPTQAAYSLTLSRDFIRAFIISLILWGIYG